MSITSFEVMLPCPPTLQFGFDPWNGARSQFYKPFSFQVYRHSGQTYRQKLLYVNSYLLDEPLERNGIPRGSLIPQLDMVFTGRIARPLRYIR